MFNKQEIEDLKTQNRALRKTEAYLDDRLVEVTQQRDRYRAWLIFTGVAFALTLISVIFLAFNVDVG